MPDTIAICPECGSPLRQRAGRGLCPRCVLRVTLAEEEDPVAWDEAPSPGSERRFGDYEVLRELGRGGMGVVYEARQISLHRIVALKMLLPSRLASPVELQRFRLEAEAVAALEHSNILPLYEIGEHQGQPFFTMKLAEGGSLAERSSEFRVSGFESHEVLSNSELETRNSKLVTLLAKVARAVHYAHERGIQHRDLKPGNILLNAQGHPFVSDFGLAKFRDRDSSLTLSASILGSPSYMAPEQAAGNTKQVTLSADVYSLGAILYELLAGRPPFVADNVPALLRKIVEDDPPPPSAANSELRSPNSDLRTVRHSFPLRGIIRHSDLDVICLKCLSKEPAKRYASAEALAEELERWLAGEPILARPISTAEKLARWCRKRPGLAASFAALLLALAGGVTGITVQWRRAEEHSRQRHLERYAADLQVASQALASHDLGLARRMVAAQIPAPNEPDVRGFEWGLLAQLCRGDHRLTLTGHTATVTCVALSPDGALAVSGGMDAAVRLWNTATGAELTNQLAHHGVVWSVAFTADGERIVSAGNDGKVRFWTRDGRAAEEPFDGRDAALSGDGTRLAVSASIPFKYFPPSRGVTVWDWRARQALFQTNLALRRVALSHDGRRLAAAGAERDVWVWDIDTGEARRLPTADTIWSLTFSRDGSHLAAAGFGAGGLVWDLTSTKPPVTLSGHQFKIWGIAFSGDGTQIATAGSDRTLQLRRVHEPDQARVFTGHDDEVWWVAWSRDGQQLATASKDMTVRLWSPAKPRDILEFPHTEYSPPVFSRDGRRLLTCERFNDGTSRVVLRDARTGQMEAAFPDRWIAAFAPDGADVILLNDYDGMLQRWSRTSGKSGTTPLTGAKRPMRLQNFAFTPDGTALAVADDTALYVWRVSDGARLGGALPLPTNGLLALAFSPQARYLAYTAPDPYVVWLHDLRDGSTRVLTNHTEEVKGLAFSSDNRLLASASVDGWVRLWNASSGRLERELARHVEEASGVAFSPDGHTLASIGAEQSVKLWHLPTGREVASLPLPDAGARIAISPVGDALAFTTRSNTVRILHVGADRR